MMDDKAGTNVDGERIDIRHAYAVCAWARHFNTSEKRLKEAVQAVGDRAGTVREHLSGRTDSDRPSAT